MMTNSYRVGLRFSPRNADFVLLLAITRGAIDAQDHHDVILTNILRTLNNPRLRKIGDRAVK